MANLPASTPSNPVFDLDLPIEVLQAIQAHPDGKNWLRQAIIAAAERDLLQRSLSQSVAVKLTTAESGQAADLPEKSAVPYPLPIGSLIRDPQFQLGYVQHYNDTTGRYTIQLNNGRVNDYPHRMLTFIEGPEEAELETKQR